MTASRLTCAYPDCDRKGEVVCFGEEAVAICTHCQRLLLRCYDGSCGRTNRIWVHYCRHCGKKLNQLNDSNCRDFYARLRIASWNVEREFGGKGLKTNVSEPSPAGGLDTKPEVVGGEDQARPSIWPLCCQEVVSCYLNDLDGFQPDNSRVTWSFLRGLLAVHQSGGVIVLAHPFVKVDQATVASAAPCSFLDDFIDSQDSAVPYEPVDVGSRFVLFTRPRCMRAVDIWTLSGWAARPSSRSYVLLIDERQGDVIIAAPPVCIDEEEYKVGVLLYRDPDYRWFVYSISKTPADSRIPLHEAWNEAEKLEISGYPCQVFVAAQQALAFASDKGQWIWSWSDGVDCGKVSRCVCVTRADEGNWCYEIDTRMRYGQPLHRQVLITREVHCSDRQSDRRLMWMFRAKCSTSSSATAFVGLRDIDLTDLDAPRLRPERLNKDLLPLGLFDGKFYFLSPNDRQFYYLVAGTTTLRLDRTLADFPDLATVQVFRDKLVIVEAHRGRKKETVNIIDLKRLKTVAKKEVNELWTWPLLVFGHLITLGRSVTGQEGNRVAVCCTKLSVTEPREGTHSEPEN